MTWTGRAGVAKILLLNLLIVAAGCPGPPKNDMGADDLAAPIDMAPGTADLSATPDLSTADLSVPDLLVADLSVPDLSVPDLSVPDLLVADLRISDLAVPGDMARPPDLSPPADLARPQDLSLPPDMARPQDLSLPPDLARPQDMSTPPDLGLMCSSAAGCGGTTPHCCADFTLGPGTPPACPVVSFNVACKATCNGNIPLSCSSTDRVRLCSKGADCAGDPGGYKNCCEFAAGAVKVNMCITDLLKVFAGPCVP